MNKRHLLIQSAVVGLMAVSVTAVGAANASAENTSASANTLVPEKNPDMEKCYGIAKAGRNDCAGKSKTHACAGKLKVNGEKESYVSVPKGTCRKIMGGKLEG